MLRKLENMMQMQSGAIFIYLHVTRTLCIYQQVTQIETYSEKFAHVLADTVNLGPGIISAS